MPVPREFSLSPRLHKRSTFLNAALALSDSRAGKSECQGFHSSKSTGTSVPRDEQLLGHCFVISAKTQRLWSPPSLCTAQHSFAFSWWYLFSIITSAALSMTALLAI